MRDINRIKSTLNAIAALWHSHPDLRLGQLICNVIQDPALYYIEDDDLVKTLRQYYQPED